MEVVVPRSFKLLEELDNRSNYTGISYGLDDPNDSTLTKWTAMVIDSAGRMSSFIIICDLTYPLNCPLVELMSTENSKVKSLFTKKNNKLVLKSSLSAIKNWTLQSSIANILLEIQNC